MGKVIVYEWMTLDGVVQAPGASDEDASGGFRHGGWHLQFFDDMSRSSVLKNLTDAGGFLLGRHTYEGFASHWPSASEEEQPLAQPLNAKPKYVASTTLREPLEWENSTLLQGDVASAVTSLKARAAGDLLVIGSAQLTRHLFENDLVDEVRLMIDPILVGGGKRAFPDSGPVTRLRLVECQSTTTGALLVKYVRDGQGPGGKHA